MPGRIGSNEILIKSTGERWESGWGNDNDIKKKVKRLLEKATGRQERQTKNNTHNGDHAEGKQNHRLK